MYKFFYRLVFAFLRMIVIHCIVLLSGLMDVNLLLLLCWEYKTTGVYVIPLQWKSYCVCMHAYIFSDRVNVSVKRVGGGFGAKLTRSQQVAAGCALAAYHTKR